MCPLFVKLDASISTAQNASSNSARSAWKNGMTRTTGSTGPRGYVVPFGGICGSAAANPLSIDLRREPTLTLTLNEPTLSHNEPTQSK